jgi:hypothetical protein
MSVGEDFQTFCNNLTVNNRDDISARYKVITKRLNIDFWNSLSETDHSLYAGSYGRGTAIRGFSDLDMIFVLPRELYVKYNNYLYNGQSALLQAVRNSLLKKYPQTAISGDGQVVVIKFSDGMKFEVVPCFPNDDGSFTYPDSNNSGKWKTTNPKPEINAIGGRDLLCNGNLKQLCRMARAWKNNWYVPMGGLLIDTLAYNFINNWEYRKKSYLWYDWMSRDFFFYLANQDRNQIYWKAAGSQQYVWRKGVFEYTAKRCYNLAQEAIDYESRRMKWSARGKWRDIYGKFYPN